MGSCSSREIEGGTRKIQQDANRQAALLRKQAEADALKAAQDEERRAKAARMKKITLVLRGPNGNPVETFQLEWDLQEQPQALQEYISKRASLSHSWNRTQLRGSDLALSIGDAAISGEMSLHQNGVTDGTVITVAMLDGAVARWQQQMEQQAEQAKQQAEQAAAVSKLAEQFFQLGRAGGGAVDGQQYTRKQCYIRALEIDDRHALAWRNLGGGIVGGQQYTKQQCYIKALENNDQLTDAWFYLGLLKGGSIGGQQYTEKQCFIKALEIDDQYVAAWYTVGTKGGVSVGGQQYTKQQCYIKALEINDQLTQAWRNLGNEGGGSVGGQQYTKQQCYIETLEINDQDNIAWSNLGFVGGGIVGGQQYTKQQCFIRALEIDDQDAYAWNNLGCVGGGSVGGQQYTKQQCYNKKDEIRREAIRAEHQAAVASLRGCGQTPVGTVVSFSDWCTHGAPDALATSGQVFFEVTLLTSAGPFPQFGWASLPFSFSGALGAGDDAASWAVDGVRGQLWHDAEIDWDNAPKWVAGDTISIAADIDKGDIWCAHNGEWVVVFQNANLAEGVFPVVSCKEALVSINLGEEPLQHPPPSDGFVTLCARSGSPTITLRKLS